MRAREAQIPSLAYVFSMKGGVTLSDSEIEQTHIVMSDRVKLELKDLVLAVKDVTDWYGLGLQLSLPRHMLDTIKAERLPVEDSMRLREMLSKWLDYDPEASWEKLASALEAIGKRAVAENVRRQFARSLTSVAAVVRAQPVEDDKETRMCH